MSGVIKSIEALNAVSQATGTYDFTSYSNFYKTGNVKGLRLIKSTGKTLGTTGTWGEIVPYTGDVVGGASKGVSAINFSSKSTGTLTASRSGALISIPAIQLVGGILAGFGLGIVAYEQNPELWVTISNKIFSIIPDYVPITAEELPALSFTTLYKNNKTYAPDYMIKYAGDALNELGAFTTIEKPIFNLNDLVVGQKINLNKSKYNYSLIKEVFAKNLDRIPNIAVIPEYSLTQGFAEFINACIATGEITEEDLLNYECFHFRFGIKKSATVQDSQYAYNLSLFNTTGNEGIVESKYDDYALLDVKSPLLGTVDGVEFSGLTAWYSHVEGNWLTAVNSYGDIWQNSAIFATSKMPVGIQLLEDDDYYWAYTSGFNASYIVDHELEGVENILGGIIPTTFPIDIYQLYPNWWANRLNWNNLNPEIQTNPLANPFINFSYLPLAIPNANPYNVPVETPQTDAQTGAVPATNPEPVIEGTQPVIDEMEDKELPTGGGGDTPPVPVIPPLGGTATALYTVYNPTKEQLNQLGAYLWSEDALSILQQLFQNPLESVIGLHILYATPTTGESRKIKLGYLNSGVSAKEVTNQYINIDCGSIVVPEYFGDARDYSPYTQINVFLPFIGIRQLDTNEIMGGIMSIDYKIDILTGTCLCMINVSKLGYSQVLYTFEGNCAVQLPLTGADKSRLLTGVIGGAFAGGMIGGTGGAVVGAIKGAIGGIKIQKTGSIGSNAGAMGIKKPYIIITRQKPYDAYNYNEQYGYPANMTVKLSSCKGFTRVKDIHVENILVATQEEKDMIQTLLKQGVIIE